MRPVLRAVLLAGCASLAGFAGAAHAQDAPAEEGGRVVVTGSRIARTGLTTATPVTAVTAQELEELSPGTLMDALDQLPQFSGNATPESSVGSWTGNVGANILNLRGIGANRTLVLLDGRRVASTTRRGTTDISTFPEALVERVDVVTGGASAAYGSDAVSGVVNFVLDTDFEGITGHVQGGVTRRGDNENFEVSLSGGHQINDRTHVLLSGDYYKNEGIEGYRDRDWYHEGWGTINDPASPTSRPLRVVAPMVVPANYTFGGLIPDVAEAGRLAKTQFLPDGTPAPFQTGDYYIRGRTTMSGGDMTLPNMDFTVNPENTRGSLFGHLTYDVTNNLEFFVQGMFGYNETLALNNPNIMSPPWAARIYADNAYLPESVRQIMLTDPAIRSEAGLRYVPFHRQTSFDEFRPMVHMINQSKSITTGFRGVAFGDWTYDVYYQHGEADQKVGLLNNVRVDRIYRSMDAVRHPSTGQIVCRSTISNPGDGCVPTSFFGLGAPSAEAYEYFTGDRFMYQEVTQDFVEASINGEVFEGWAGPIGVAFGASYREDHLNQFAEPVGVSSNEPGCTPTAASQGYRGLPATFSSCYGIFERGSVAVINGGFDVKEAFGEIIVPLVSGVRGVDQLDFNGAVRTADYSGSGNVVAWKTGLDWTVFSDLRFRATASRDTRAGTLSERFDETRSAGSAEDPVLGETYTFSQIAGGDENIEPEIGETITFGGIYQPSWLPGLGISADYYDIKIEGAIGQIGVQNIIDGCYDNNEQMLCDRIVRDPSTGFITEVFNTFVNIDEARTRGIDVEAVYRTSLDLFGREGGLSVRTLVSHVMEQSQLVGGTFNEAAGEAISPEWRGTMTVSYNTGPWGMSVTNRYIGPAERNVDWVEGIDITDNDIDAAVYTNLRLSYDFTRFGSDNQVYLSVQNLFDRDPNTRRGQNGGSYDEIGQAFTAGLRFAF
jgi:outer membrane receptor protein involved in Fe transport